MMCLVVEDVECVEKCFSLNGVDFDQIPLDFRVVLYQVLATANQVLPPSCAQKHAEVCQVLASRLKQKSKTHSEERNALEIALLSSGDAAATTLLFECIGGRKLTM